MKPLHYEALCKMLLERFGEPIGDLEAPPTSSKKKDMGNRGFGSQLDEAGCCDQCGRMSPGMDQAHGCAQATNIDERDGEMCKCGGERLQNMPNGMVKCKDCGRTWMPVDEKAPPGGEKVVKALKKDKDVENPWAVAWAMKNRGEI